MISENTLDILVGLIAILIIGFMGLAIISGMLSFAYWFIFLAFAMTFLILMLFVRFYSIL